MATTLTKELTGICKVCGRETPWDDSLGNNVRCVDCWDRLVEKEANKKVADSQRRYRQENREKVADSQRRYRQENREKLAAKRRGEVGNG